MEITQVKVHYKDVANSKLKAFVTVTLDDMFVVHDLKVIEGKNGYFVAMPSVKRKMACTKCGKKNSVGSKHCNECGEKFASLSAAKGATEEEVREDHKDIAHPITASARDYIQKAVLEVYKKQRTENK